MSDLTMSKTDVLAAGGAWLNHRQEARRMADIEVREARRGDAAALTELLNAIIARGGTTALEDPYTPERFAEAYIDGPDVHCCFVAVDPATGRLEGYQSLGRSRDLPAEVGDIGTFARLGGAQRGVGSALFAATRDRAAQLGLAAINATIRADNAGGLTFYAKQGFRDHSTTPSAPLKNGSLVDRVNKRFALRPA
jgi:L-amino acid N-acyltransferase YncA